jgi:hypothetical protein
MYTVSELIKAAKHPIFILRELNILYHTRLRSRGYNPNGTNIFEEDWDNLILLDACRLDLFEECVDFHGDLESRISRGATSPEFIRGNFADATHHDTVYVTGNGWYFRLRDEINANLYDEFNVEHNGKDPSPITSAAVDAYEEYPSKRLIVHYMHPHVPYVGETAKDVGGYDLTEGGRIGEIQRREISVPDGEMRQAYKETLEYILNEVSKLLKKFDGKTVISSDHGEMLGERCSPVPIKDYAHHGGLYVPELVEVPWFVHQSGERKEIDAGEPKDKPSPDKNIINDRLRKLGYKPS